MKIKENIKIKQIGDETILVSNEKDHVNFTRVISLNRSAEFLIKESLDKEFTVLDWAEKLSVRYGVDKSQAVSDVQALIDKLSNAGVLYE